MKPKVVGKYAVYRGIKLFIGSEDHEYYYVTASRVEQSELPFMIDAIYLGHSEWMGKIDKSEIELQIVEEAPPNTYKAP